MSGFFWMRSGIANRRSGSTFMILTITELPMRHNHEIAHSSRRGIQIHRQRPQDCHNESSNILAPKRFKIFERYAMTLSHEKMIAAVKIFHH